MDVGDAEGYRLRSAVVAAGGDRTKPHQRSRAPGERGIAEEKS